MCFWCFTWVVFLCFFEFQLAPGLLFSSVILFCCVVHTFVVILLSPLLFSIFCVKKNKDKPTSQVDFLFSLDHLARSREEERQNSETVFFRTTFVHLIHLFFSSSPSLYFVMTDDIPEKLVFGQIYQGCLLYSFCSLIEL